MILIEFKGDDLAMLRAALACAASATSVRDYLRSVYITPQYVSATSGHKYARFDTPGDHEDFDVIVPYFRLPKSTVHLVMMVDGDKITLHQTAKTGGNTPTELTAIDHKYPDLSQVIPSDEDRGMTDMLKFNPLYLREVTDALDLGDFPTVSMVVTGDARSSVYRVEYRDYPGLAFGIMPIYLK